MFGCIEIAKHDLEVKGQAAAGIACANCSFECLSFLQKQKQNSKFLFQIIVSLKKRAAGIACTNCSFECLAFLVFLVKVLTTVFRGKLHKRRKEKKICVCLPIMYMREKGRKKREQVLHCWGGVRQMMTTTNKGGRAPGSKWNLGMLHFLLVQMKFWKWLDALRGSSPAHCNNGT